MSSTYRLVLKSGANAGQTFPLDAPEMTIGREPSNEIVVTDPEVSRRHARLYLQGQNYVIEDNGSTNGTSVNGQRLVGPYILRPGEMVTLGENTHLLFEEMVIDPDATRVSVRPPVESMPPQQLKRTGPLGSGQPPVQPAQPAPVYEPAPMDSGYSGQIPSQPEEVKPRRRLSPIVIVLIIVVILGLCACLAFWAFDTLNLYCQVPGITNMIFPNACP